MNKLVEACAKAPHLLARLENPDDRVEDISGLTANEFIVILTAHGIKFASTDNKAKLVELAKKAGF